jgi:hypothetical protein
LIPTIFDVNAGPSHRLAQPLSRVTIKPDRSARNLTVLVEQSSPSVGATGAGDHDIHFGGTSRRDRPTRTSRGDIGQ